MLWKGELFNRRYRGWRNTVFFSLFLVSIIALAAPQMVGAAEPLIKIGVQTKGNLQEALRMWPPTAEYLSEAVPGYRFEVVPLNFREIDEAVAAGQVDFVVPNSGTYVELEARYGISRIATLKKHWMDGIYATSFGATIFARSDRLTLRRLENIKGKRFAAVDPDSFGGWRMAWREMAGASIDPADDLASLTFVGSSRAVLEAVLDGRADVGTVRTGLIEQWAQAGIIDIADLNILHDHRHGDSHEGAPQFPFIHSTRLYPEWPFAKLRHTPVELAEKVAVALIEMPVDHRAAIAARSMGWTVPLSYQPVHELMRELKIGPYADPGHLTPRQFLQRYWHLIALALGVIAVLSALLVRVYRLNRRLQGSERGLAREKERLQTTLASIGDGVVTTDIHGHVEYLNGVAERHLGVSNEAARGQPLAAILELVGESDYQAVVDPVRRCIDARSAIYCSDLLLLQPDSGLEFHVHLVASPIMTQGGRISGAVLVFHDVTELHHLARQLTHQASHDALTGLANRREFEVRLEEALLAALNEGVPHALCYLDLDQFKLVNDSCGHVAGDALLKRLASQLQAQIRESDTLARLGGDEFGVLFSGCTLDKALELATNLQNVVKSFHFVWEERVFDVGVSIGIVPIDQESGTITDLLSAADSACYIAKEQGPNRIHLFHPNDQALMRHRGHLQWVQRIKQGLDRDNFRLVCQPIRPLAEGAGEGWHFEVLVRLEEEGRTMLPGAFLPAAERYHLMPQIDRWVIETALTMLAREAEAVNRQNVCCAINMSGQSLSDDQFLAFVTGQIEASGIKPERLCFEVTESSAIANLGAARHLIAELRDMGCRFSLDDFGSGLSSFEYLKNLTVDYLKIDGSFVRDIAHDPIDRAMVEAIRKVGEVMGIATIAEFVEDEATLACLRQMGVDYVQGFAVGKPRPLAHVLEEIAAAEDSAAVPIPKALSTR